MLKKLNERKLQIQECKVQEVKSSDGSSGGKDSNGIVSEKGNAQSLENQNSTSRDESSSSRNECNEKITSWDDTDIRPSYDIEPIVEVPYTAEYNVFGIETQHSKQPEYMNDTSLMEKVNSNTTPDSSDICNNEFKDDQNDDYEDERVVLANLIANLKLDIDENKEIQKQLRNVNASLTQELKECKSIIKETSRTLGESNSTRDSCLVALQNKQSELETYKATNDRTVDYGKLKQKHDDLVKQSILTKSMYKGLVKEKTKIPYDTSDLANRFSPGREDTLTLEQESRSKLNKDLVKPYDYTKQNSLYEIFKPPTHKELDQLWYANETRKKM
ncbi:hypothetical protein Tco_1035801 [Tanacetum coccineum]